MRVRKTLRTFEKEMDRMNPQRNGPQEVDRELADTFTAISVVAKKLATRIRAGKSRQERKGHKNGQDKRV